MKKSKTTYWVIGIVVVLAVLFVLPRLSSNNYSGSNSGVPCLIPNVALLQHIHPVIKISVDGKTEEIPAGVGLAGCERAVHTHIDDVSQGIVHIESQDRREYTLGDFMSVWGQNFSNINNKDLSPAKYVLKVFIDGKELADSAPADIVFKDGQVIELKYTHIFQ